MDAEILDYILKALAVLALREELVDVSFDNFTPDALRVLASAREAMRELHLNFIGTEGLLLGLLAIKPSNTSEVLNKAGVEFDTVQALFREWLDSVTVSPEKISAEIPFTPRAYRVLELAADQTKQLGATQVDTGHLLLGILKEGEQGGGMAMRALVQGCGVELRGLESQVRKVIST